LETRPFSRRGPLRVAYLVGDLPLATSPYRLGTLGVVTLVALRLIIGWHFYQEGVQKIHEPEWTAAGFFTGSKGPLKPYFEMMVYDMDGRARLSYAETKSGKPTIDVNQTLDLWKQYQSQVERDYGFDDSQKKAAEECFKRYERQLKWVVDTNRDEMIKYFYGLERRDKNRQDAARRQVPSLRGQSDTIEQELTMKRGPWLAQVDKLWKGYARDMNAIAVEEQAAGGPVKLAWPGRGMLFGLMDNLTIDRIIPTFDTVVGALLILGLGTRIAALAGAGFLFSICLTQWPGAPGALPIYYQAIEMVALLVLAAVAAGQFAGLDFIIHRFYSSFRTSKQESNQ
jgi:uncharacterized membrane protein YphA (DoxX/SURF4 family)